MTITDTELQELAEQKRREMEESKAALGGMQKVDLPELVTVLVNKQCRSCGAQWRGKFFKEWILKAPKATVEEKRYILAYCDACIESWERDQKRRHIEVDLQTVDAQLRMGPTKAKKIRLMRTKSGILIKMRDTYEPGAVEWSKITDRVRDLNAMISKLEQG